MQIQSGRVAPIPKMVRSLASLKYYQKYQAALADKGQLGNERTAAQKIHQVSKRQEKKKFLK